MLGMPETWSFRQMDYLQNPDPFLSFSRRSRYDDVNKREGEMQRGMCSSRGLRFLLTLFPYRVDSTKRLMSDIPVFATTPASWSVITDGLGV